MHGHTRLTDYYRGDLSLRELSNRLWSLPHDADLWGVVADEQERVKSHQRGAEVERALAIFKRKGV